MPVQVVVSVVIPVFRDAPRALAAARAIQRQRLGRGAFEVIVVDDGSQDDLQAQFHAAALHNTRVLRLERNLGRSAARNAGACAATGNVVVFMDSDCLPADDSLLAAHDATITSGSVASTGHVRGHAPGFWNRYQSEASDRRAAQHAAGTIASGSSQNLAVARDAFCAVGGFDVGYRRYGFEDRDLLARLGEVGRVTWTADAVVVHTDALDLPTVARKLALAGNESGARFAERHPSLYRALGYARLDLSTRPRLARVLGPIMALAIPVAHAVDPVLEWGWLPYRLRRLAVRGVSAAAFAAGSARRASSDVRSASSKSP